MKTFILNIMTYLAFNIPFKSLFSIADEIVTISPLNALQCFCASAHVFFSLISSYKPK